MVPVPWGNVQEPYQSHVVADTKNFVNATATVGQTVKHVLARVGTLRRMMMCLCFSPLNFLFFSLSISHLFDSLFEIILDGYE